MTELEYRQVQLAEAESSAKQHHEDMEHHERIYFLNERSEYSKFSLLKPKLYKEGNQWCVLYGDDIQSGIAGFGNSPHLAIMDWNKQWHLGINPY